MKVVVIFGKPRDGYILLLSGIPVFSVTCLEHCCPCCIGS